MTKLNIAFTLDEDIIKWLDHKQNKSKYTNSLLRDQLDREADPDDMLRILDEQIEDLTKEQEDIIKNLEIVMEDGARKDREQAEVVIRKQVDAQNERNKIIRDRYALIKNTAIWKEFKALCKGIVPSIKILMEYSKKFQDKGHKIDASSLRDIMKLEVINGKKVKND